MRGHSPTSRLEEGMAVTIPEFALHSIPLRAGDAQ